MRFVLEEISMDMVPRLTGMRIASSSISRGCKRIGANMMMEGLAIGRHTYHNDIDTVFTFLPSAIAVALEAHEESG